MIFQDRLDELRQLGWSVELLDEPRAVPEHISSRYADVPTELSTLVMGLKLCVNSDGTAWMICAPEFEGGNESAFRWNEIELISLEAARMNPAWKREIAQFWDQHFPLMLSVKVGYAFFAYRLGGSDPGAIVHGFEPAFEEPTLVANTLGEFLSNLVLAAKGELEGSELAVAI